MLNWIKYNEKTFDEDIKNNNLVSKEIIFKMKHYKEGLFEHHIGTATLNNLGQLIIIVGGHFLFDYNKDKIVSFADLSEIL